MAILVATFFRRFDDLHTCHKQVQIAVNRLAGTSLAVELPAPHRQVLVLS